MTVKIPTKNLVDLLEDLVLTADGSKDAGIWGNVMLYTVRASIGAEPGEGDVLCGVAYDGTAIGHTYCETFGGQLARPVLWPVADCKALIQVFKAAARNTEVEHAVDIRSELGVATVRELENPSLFDGPDDARRFAFAQYPLDDKYPGVGLFRMLDKQTLPKSTKDEEVPLLPRTDFSAVGLAPFVKIANRRGGKLVIYRDHQAKRVLVEVGARYRGALRPVTYEPIGPCDEPDVEILRPDMDQLAEMTGTTLPAQRDPDAGAEVEQDPTLQAEQLAMAGAES